jgi:hypothetical protein
MSFNYSPKIVNDGLILYLDAANPKSLVSGTTVWYDISRLSKTTTMVNGPTFTTEKGGGLVFDGVNDYVTLGTDQDYYFNLTKPYTISIWFKSNSLSTMGLVTRYNSGIRGHYFLKFLLNGAIMYNREVSPFNLFSNGILSIGVINNVVISYDGTYQKIYLNGVFDRQQLSGNIVQNQSNINLFIGASQSFGNPNEFFNGTIYNVSIYKKGLSQQEITQNYNALKTRFGL